jgi:hypothetical protein
MALLRMALQTYHNDPLDEFKLNCYYFNILLECIHPFSGLFKQFVLRGIAWSKKRKIYVVFGGLHNFKIGLILGENNNVKKNPLINFIVTPYKIDDSSLTFSLLLMYVSQGEAKAYLTFLRALDDVYGMEIDRTGPVEVHIL